MYYSTTHKASVSQTEGESLRSRLLESLKDYSKTRPVLERMMDLSGAEFCAFYSAAGEGILFVLLDGKGLSAEVPYITEKLLNAYQLFNNSQSKISHYIERVYYLPGNEKTVYPSGTTSIESYFLVPVISSSKVEGVVFVGSLRKEAFTRREIEVFNKLAGDDRSDPAVVYRVSGGVESAMNLVSCLPFGGSLLSAEGMLVYSNEAFESILNIKDLANGSIMDIRGKTGYDFPSLWDELKLTGKSITGKLIKSSKALRPLIKVSWTKIENISEDVDSLLVIEPADSGSRDRFEEEEVLSVVAHEIRTPLSALKNSLKILADEDYRCNGDTSAAAFKNQSLNSIFQTAIRTTEKLDLLVDGIVTVSPTGVDRFELNVEETSSRDFIESACSLFLKLIEKRKINLVIDIAGNIPVIEIDRNRIEQVLQNLLSNSLKNVPSGGEIRITLAEATLPKRSVYSAVPWNSVLRPSLIEIRMEDSGDGFPPNVLMHVNNMSEAGRQRRTPRYGLGLYIASGLVRLHGGILRIGNREEGGAECRVFIPADERTRRIIVTLMEIEDRIGEEAAKGNPAVFYLICKDSSRCWLEVVGNWEGKPLVNPERGEISEMGLYFWPLWENTAVALATGKEFISDPPGMVRSSEAVPRLIMSNSGDQVEVGWSFSTGKYANIRRMVEEAAKMLEKGSTIPV